MQTVAADQTRATVRVSGGTEAAEGRTAKWIERYRAIRQHTESLCKPLVTEDYVVQSMPDVSPTKWHLAHTTWFFETFVLSPHSPGYSSFDPHFAYLFNSYYVTVGDRHCRQNRGLLSRPTVSEVYAYRKHVDAGMARFLAGLSEAQLRAIEPIMEIGLHHEQQHQELMLTDIKHVFWVNPLRPAYQDAPKAAANQLPPMRWIEFQEGLHWIGHEEPGFAFDNESPRHRTFLESFKIGSRLVTNAEFKRFIEEGGYRHPELWLSMGWATVQAEDWHAPLYWIEADGRWLNHTLHGLCPVQDEEPVCHVSYFEADAYARWAGARLPSEFEWEVGSRDVPVEGNFIDANTHHPQPLAEEQSSISQMFGDVWEWTRSAYLPYPGYRPPAGALGEYNGKFMCNQFVLRGGSCATPRSHIRPTYRNFFPPDARWQFSGFRLARDA
jgi:ergothioneine biosynthesis protein EgtB